MKRSLYGERDYAFGQLMLTLRTHIGLTQASLAQRLGISRRAVSTWELGSNYPASAHLKELIVLGMRASAFPAGHEEEEIRAFWRAAHQKVLLDEQWLQGLLGTGALSSGECAGHGRHRQVGAGGHRDAPGGGAVRGGALALPA